MINFIIGLIIGVWFGAVVAIALVHDHKEEKNDQ